MAIFDESALKIASGIGGEITFLPEIELDEDSFSFLKTVIQAKGKVWDEVRWEKISVTYLWQL